MHSYNISAFCLLLENFFDILNNWYIRLSRERFWGTSVEKSVQIAAFNTLYVVLVDVAKIVAPVMPFVSDYIYKNLTGERSVHLSDFPIAGARDEKLMNNMDNIISICSAVKILRENENIRNRQPLNSVKICSKNIENIKPFNDLLLSECNVKEVVYDNETEKYAQNILYIYTPIVGKRLRAKLKDINICKNKGDYKVEGRKCYIAGEVLNEDEFEIKIEILNGLKGKATGDNSAVVILDTVITEELKAEGVIKDFIRAIQESRKNLDFDVSDRIKLYFNADGDMVQNINKWAEFIKNTTLTTEIISSDEVLKYELDGAKVTFNIEKV